MEIKDKSFYGAWKKILKYILKDGKTFVDDDSRVCYEYLGMSIIIEEGGDPLKMIERLNKFDVWVYPNEEEIKKILLTKENYFSEFSLGSRIFNYSNAINQVDDFVIPLLKRNKKTRRAIVSLWNPTTDSKILKKDVPSNLIFMFKIVNDKVNVYMTIRSNDMFFGFPTDAYITYLLQDYVAKKLGLERGKITIYSLSAHLFEDQIPYIKEILNE